VPGRFQFGDYALASLILSAGIYLDYLCIMYFGTWLGSFGPWSLASALLSGFLAVSLLFVGLTGLFHRPGREARVLEDRIVLRSEWSFDARETVIPFERVWKFYANLNNDFPSCFLVWKDQKDQCKWLGFDKEDIPGYESEVSRLKERMPVDTENYAVSSYVKRDVKMSLGCEPVYD